MPGRLLPLAISILFVAPTAARANPLTPVWITTHKLEHYLEHDLKVWGGVKLAGADLKVALCLRGDHSKAETRIGKTYQTLTTKSGKSRYASFACTLSVSGLLSFSLYIRPQARSRWLIIANR
jgi:hypothetical protein